MNCECGCGQPAPIAKGTDHRFGHVQGKPMRFILGHVGYRRIKADPMLGRTRNAENGCIEWTGQIGSEGYGALSWKGKPWTAHRLAWTLTHGSIPAGLHVLHRCDNRACCNTDHLFLGTHADNMHDAIAKGRNSHGERVPNTKLTAVRAVELRRRAASGEPLSQIAREFGISYYTAWDVKAGRRWKQAEADLAAST